jgi:hypothetical protein
VTTSHSWKIGWAETDITPQKPVSVAGNFNLRISEGVADPIYATVWALEMEPEQAVFVSCDILSIPDDLRDDVRARLAGNEAGLDPMKVILHATHTHQAPEVHVRYSLMGNTSAVGNGVELHEISPDIMPVEAYVEWLAERIAETVMRAWTSRSAGGLAFGLGFAVIGRNRRWVDTNGQSTMHGLDAATHDRFRYIEGYEDHSLNVMATYDADGKLTGLILNLACTAQTPGNTQPYHISADHWCDTRSELRRRFGEHLFILPQCSPAGEQTAHEQFDKQAEARMRRLKGRTKRQEIAHTIANTVEDLLPWIGKEIDNGSTLRHHVETVDLPANRLTEEEVRAAVQEADLWLDKLKQEQAKLADQPELRQAPRWYNSLSIAARREQWLRKVAVRHEQRKQQPSLPSEIHVLRIGEALFASVPFEYYLDFGVQIKMRSPATQNFLIQLAGDGTYVPSERSIAGGGYGSTAPSNPIGHEGGQQLAEYVVATMRSVWASGKNHEAAGGEMKHGTTK